MKEFVGGLLQLWLMDVAWRDGQVSGVKAVSPPQKKHQGFSWLGIASEIEDCHYRWYIFFEKLVGMNFWRSDNSSFTFFGWSNFPFVPTTTSQPFPSRKSPLQRLSNLRCPSRHFKSCALEYRYGLGVFWKKPGCEWQEIRDDIIFIYVCDIYYVHIYIYIILFLYSLVRN